MLRLIQADFPPTGKPDLHDRAPSGFFHVRTGDTLFPKCGDLSRQIGAHEVQLVTPVVVGRMERGLRRRQGKKQPSPAGIDGRKSQDVPEEAAIGFRSMV
jgi:hypothetical protein